MKKFTSVIIASLLIASGLFAQKSPIVGVVDVERVLGDYTAFQAALEKVRGSVAHVEEEIQKMQASIEKIVTDGRAAETKAKNPAASDEARAEAQAEVTALQQQLQEAQQQFQQFRQQAQALAQRGQQEELAPLQETAIEAVKTVAADKGIDLVLPKKSLIFSSDSLEISDAVIAVLNAAN